MNRNRYPYYSEYYDHLLRNGHTSITATKQLLTLNNCKLPGDLNKEMISTLNGTSPSRALLVLDNEPSIDIHRECVDAHKAYITFRL